MKRTHLWNLGLVFALAVATVPAQQTTSPLPSEPLKFGAFVVKFDASGTFSLQGKGWPALNGNWKSKGDEIELAMTGGPGGCDGPGRYQYHVDGKRVSFSLVSDD